MMLRNITGNIAKSNGILGLSNSRLFMTSSILAQTRIPFNNNNNNNSQTSSSPQDILRAFPKSQKGDSDVGLNVSFNSMKQSNTSMNAERDTLIILPEQIREEAAALRKFSIMSGRTATVNNCDTATACRRLSSLLFANEIAIDRRKQRFHMKPGKKAELKRSQRHRKDFMKGFKRLMEVVKDAKRKGY